MPILFICIVLHPVGMASILESTAAFETRATGHGLTAAEVTVLKGAGVNSLARLAFAIATPGVNPQENELRSLLNRADPDSVTIGSLASLRRLMFEAQTLAIQQVKNQVEGSESVRKEFVPAERSSRIEAQKVRLAGYDLSGPLECSFASYDLRLELLEKDSVYYLAPHKFTTRSSEVAREKPGKELVIDSNSLKINDVKHNDQVAISNELELSQAFTRRALASDVVGLVDFQRMEKWHRYLFQQLSHSPPPGYSKPTIEQLLRADRAAWIRLAETCSSVKRTGAGVLPLNDGFDNLQNDSTVNFHLLPLPQSGTKKVADPPIKKIKKVKGKGNGKMPRELLGLNQSTASGDRICYNYNLKHGCKYAKPGQSCKKGKHICMKCQGQHSQLACKKSDE